MKKNFLYTILLLTSITIMFSACSKDTSGAELDLSYKMLADKTWYLEYTQTISSTATTQKTYVGQSTYFINFLKNLTTNDSDGLSGTYTVQKPASQLQIKVSAKTASGSASNYTYNVETLGAKNMVLSFVNGTTQTKFFFSTQK